jgi:heat shock protein HtpX
MGAFGLQTHIWNNNLKSVLLLAAFPLLLVLLLFGLTAGYVGLVEELPLAEGIASALAHMTRIWPFALAAAALWYLIAWGAHNKLIEASVGARGLARKEAPELYNLLENLSIANGMAMPKLSIIETPAMNAFASGVSDKSYAITVTRGLIESLNREEIEAVLAHELTHIRNRDVRLLIIAVIFVGVFSFFGEMLFRGTFDRGVRIGGHSRSRKGDSRGGGILILIAVAAILLAWLLAVVIRFALSQKREFLADAGSAQLTKNSDAMVSALKKISGGPPLNAPADVRRMTVHSPSPFAGLFATHPPIEKRIAALSRFAGAAA